MAKYTLFVDESGDFESNRGEWVLSGALCKAPFAAAEKQIGNVAAAIPAKYGLAERKDLHMHDLRRKWGHERALNVARSVLEAIGRLEIHVQLVGVVNRSKRRIGQRES